MSIQTVRMRLDNVLQFMAPHWSWVNCHMVNYLTDDHWKIYVPLQLQKELSSAESIGDCIETVFWNVSDGLEKNNNKFPHFKEFRKQAELHSLHAFEDIIINPQNFKQNILKVKTDLKKQIAIKEFLTEKKRHEVEVTARLVNELIYSSPWKSQCVVVDAGDGKGYLSSRLALEYGHTVLGIDSNNTNTKNAIERSKKLKKSWNGLKERAELISEGITPARRSNWKQKLQQKSIEKEHITPSNETYNYKTINKFITSNMDLDNFLHEQFFESLHINNTKICLTGLHTCGNLAATCLQLFHSQKSCKLLCNIGCCYHLLNEQFSGPEFFGNKSVLNLNKEFGFPLSQYLKDKKVTLGRNARMLAAQSIERIMNAKELPNISLYYRALLELLICEHHPELKDCIQVGKIRKFSNFQEYVNMCRNKYSHLNFKNERIAEVTELESQRNSKGYLELFYLLRMTFAPVLESLILLDRLLYLKELGYSESFLVPVFDPVVSPRHFAILALKNEHQQ